MAIEPSFKLEIEDGAEKMKKKSTGQETIRFDWPSPESSNSNSTPKIDTSSQGESESEETSDSSSSSGSIGSTKYSADLMSTRSELKKTLKKSRSRKLTTLGSFRSSRRRAKSRFDQANVVSRENGQYPTSIEVSDASPSHCSQTSSRHSESSFGSCENGNGEVSSLNSQLEKFSRTSSLRTKRVLKKNKTSFKPKKPSKEKHLEVTLDPSLGKATYSSMLKDSKFPKVEDEPEKIDAMKVCPYHHCSLHGHHHHDLPDKDPPKRFEYLKRRSVKSLGTEKSQLATAVKRSGKKREEGRGSKALPVVGDRGDFSIEFYAKNRSEPVLEAIKENEDAVLADILFGVRSLQGNLNANRDAFAEGIDIREGTSCRSCFDAQKMEESSSEDVHKDFGAISMKGDDKISTIEEKTATLNVELREDKSSYITERSVENDFGGAEQAANATSSASNLLHSDKCSTTIEERSRESNLDRELVDGPTQRDSEANISELSSADHEANKSQVKKNRLSMWHMIHRQMVSGLAAEAGNEPLKQPDEEKQVHLPERKDFGSQTNFSDSDTDTESQDLASQDIEIRKMFAIKLVREAIEKILLPEVQDDQSITSDVTSEQDLSEKNQGEVVEEPSISTRSLESDIINDATRKDEQKAAVKEGKKSESKAPQRWSYLKKVILLNKFIKELEKVKKFTPKKPQLLPLEPEQEAEKVSLRRGLIGEKKNSEEWMLDFALRQVVSELAPKQKRKVALLVKAFETVAPSQEEQQIKVAVPKLRNSIPKGCSQQLPVDIKKHDSKTDLNTGISEFTGVGIQMEAALHVSSSNGEPLQQNTAAGEEKNREPKLDGIFPRDIPTPSDSKLDGTVKGAQGEELDSTKRLKMWHMIYQHVVTNIAEKVGTQLLLDEADEEVDDEKKLSSVKASENDDASHERLELSRSVAVKLVQEAVDEILLPEVQDDSSDTQSVANDISQSQEERESAVEAPTLKNKFDTQKSKNWSKLKKLIILKRSIRALEQVRKVNLRRPQEISLVSDPEGKKVDLKSQMTDERKKAEQWMLDYAVRNIVTTLTPARKRRVAMLVEAFEAVVPLPEV